VSSETFKPGLRAPETLDGDTLAFGFRGRRLLVHQGESEARVPTLAELEGVANRAGFEPVRRQYLGRLERRHVVSLELPEAAESPAGTAFRDLRGLFPQLPEAHFWLAARAVQIVDWDRDHQFCPRCAAAFELHPDERAKRCPKCALTAYPRLAPAVIVAVTRGEEILLARSPHFPPGMWSVLAGFVEPGENLEECVAREVEEEVGVRVRKIRYVGSQPWPFPHSLMIGFHAEYAEGELKLEDPEIEDAAWYPRDSLPQIPPPISIARRLIDAFRTGAFLSESTTSR